MKEAPPLSRTEMIERSLSCFKLGIWGLLPVIGVPMALLALNHYKRVKNGQGTAWNPARQYLFWGCFCARLGLWPIFIIAALGALIAGMAKFHWWGG